MVKFETVELNYTAAAVKKGLYGPCITYKDDAWYTYEITDKLPYVILRPDLDQYMLPLEFP